MQQARPYILLGAALLAIAFLAAAWGNSLAVTGVAIRVKEGVPEHNDHSIGMIGAQDRLPDYKVKLRLSRRWLALDLGTRLNTSATNWVEFPLQEPVPVRTVQEIIIIEDDKIENDTLDRIGAPGLESEGASFHCRISVKRSFAVGFDWFFDTPFGKMLASGIGLAIVIVVVSWARQLGLSGNAISVTWL